MTTTVFNQFLSICHVGKFSRLFVEYASIISERNRSPTSANVMTESPTQRPNCPPMSDKRLVICKKKIQRSEADTGAAVGTVDTPVLNFYLLKRTS